jgi:hypothetical protein
MNNNNIIRLKQHQILTPNLFSQIVSSEIERHFNERYLTDQRVNSMIYDRCFEYKASEVTAEETYLKVISDLKQEIYDLFFKSFAEVWSKINKECIHISETTGNKKKLGEELYVCWFDSKHTIEDYKLIDLHEHEEKSYTVKIEPSKVHYDYAIYAYKYLVGKRKKNIFEPHDLVPTTLCFKAPITYKFRMLFVYFFATAKHSDEPSKDEPRRLSGYTTRYSMNLYSRVKLIVNHVIDKHIFGPIIESTKGMKPLTEEERHVTTKDGKTLYKHDWYSVAKLFVYDWMRQAKYDEQKIWKPDLVIEQNDNSDRNKEWRYHKPLYVNIGNPWD